MVDASDLDRELIEFIQNRDGIDVDAKSLSEEIESLTDNPELSLEYGNSSDPNKSAAFSYTMVSENIGGDSVSYTDLISNTFQFGCLTISETNEFHLFEPCIIRMLEMNERETKECLKLHQEFYKSDYETIINQASDRAKFTTNISVEQNADHIKTGLKGYGHGMDVVERGFPLLLAVKRILEGEEKPDLEVLQNLKLSAVRRELTNKSTQEYPYFDQIANAVNINLRNGIAHGDIVIQPTNSILSIKNGEKRYKFSEVAEDIEKLMSIVVFLTGTFQATIPLSAATLTSDLTQSDIIPNY